MRPLPPVFGRHCRGVDPAFKREALLCAWVITWEGKKVRVRLSPGTKQSTECCGDLIEEMKRRGLSDPLRGHHRRRPWAHCGGGGGFPRFSSPEVSNAQDGQPCRQAPLRAEFAQAPRAAYQAPSVAMAQVLREDVMGGFAKQADNEAPVALSLDTAATVMRLVDFYVQAHNTDIPHAAFRGQTPDEMYYGRGNDIPENVETGKAQARAARLQPTERCPVDMKPSST